MTAAAASGEVGREESDSAVMIVRPSAYGEVDMMPVDAVRNDDGLCIGGATAHTQQVQQRLQAKESQRVVDALDPALELAHGEEWAATMIVRCAR
jgi:hypothetical protein